MARLSGPEHRARRVRIVPRTSCPAAFSFSILSLTVQSHGGSCDSINTVLIIPPTRSMGGERRCPHRSRPETWCQCLSTGSLASVSQTWDGETPWDQGHPPASRPLPHSPTTRLWGSQVDEETLGRPAEVRCRLRGNTAMVSITQGLIQQRCCEGNLWAVRSQREQWSINSHRKLFQHWTLGRTATSLSELLLPVEL